MSIKPILASGTLVLQKSTIESVVGLLQRNLPMVTVEINFVPVGLESPVPWVKPFWARRMTLLLHAYKFNYECELPNFPSNPISRVQNAQMSNPRYVLNKVQKALFSLNGFQSLTRMRPKGNLFRNVMSRCPWDQLVSA